MGFRRRRPVSLARPEHVISAGGPVILEKRSLNQFSGADVNRQLKSCAVAPQRTQSFRS